MDVSFGLKPFWFWNGAMEDDEISRQVKEMADKNVRGFFIHPRQGLEIPYLSEEWFYKVGVAIEAAKKHDLEVWLYDEYPYPSGISGGEVTLAHPELKAQTLEHKTLIVDGPKHIEVELPWGETVLACAYPMEADKTIWEEATDLSEYIGIIRKEHIFQMSGLTNYNRKRYFTGDSAKRLSWDVPLGRWKIYMFIQTPVKHFKYFGEFIDPLNPDAIKYFIQTTHERYKKHFGGEFGHAIKGIFSDEVAPMGEIMPWSPMLPNIFYEQCGYPLVPMLPSLLEYMNEKTYRFRYDYFNTVTDAFIRSFDCQIRDWCHENGLLYVGEKPILRSSQLKYMDIPGIDAGHQKAGSLPEITSSNYRANPKILASAAHFYKKERALCECFHSIGWGMSMQDMKWMFDWLGVQGINTFVPHAFFYTTDGLTKHDAPPSSFFQMPAWDYMKDMSDYVTYLSRFVTEGERRIKILLLDPITSNWIAVGDLRDVGIELKKNFADLQRELLEQHWDFYVIDPELLNKAIIKGNKMFLNNECFDALILPPMLGMDDASFVKIKEYIENDGRIIAVSCLPTEGIGEAYEREWFNHVFNDIGNKNAIFISDIKEISVILDKILIRDISIESEGRQNKNILAAHFELDGKDRYLCVNTSGQKQDVILKLRKNRYSGTPLNVWQLGFKDKRIALKYGLDNDYINLCASFEPYASIFLEVDSEYDRDLTSDIRVADAVYNVDADSHWEIETASNFLRMGEWELSIYQQDASDAMGCANVICEPIIDQLNDGRFTVPVKIDSYFGCPKYLLLPQLKCSYRYSFNCDVQCPIWLVMEPNSIYGKWYIKVNESNFYPEDFVKKEFYLPSNLALDISKAVKSGCNSIQVFVEASRNFDGLVNPLYLCGAFYTYKEGERWELSLRPGKGRIMDTIGCGIPFYSGKITYKKAIWDLPCGKDILFKLEDKHIEGPVGLYVNDHSIGVRCWNPYIWHVDKAYIREGANDIAMQVTTTLLGLFEGEIFVPDEYGYRSIDK